MFYGIVANVIIIAKPSSELISGEVFLCLFCDNVRGLLPYSVADNNQPNIIVKPSFFVSLRTFFNKKLVNSEIFAIFAASLC